MLQKHEIFQPWAIGFEDIFDRLLTAPAAVNYPPYNVANVGDNKWIVEVAVAGFAKEDLKVTVHKGRLKIAGEKVKETNTTSELEVLVNEPRYQHQGISSRSFCRLFELSENVEVRDVALKDGLLTVNLEKVVREADIPRVIDIA